MESPDANPVASTTSGLTWLSIPAMDCAAEEAEIRHALSKLPGVRSLQFRLVSRNLGIDIDTASIPLAVEAISKAGFKAQVIVASVETQSGRNAHEHNHSQTNIGSDASGRSFAGMVVGTKVKLGLALVLACAAEAVSYFAPEALMWKGIGMVVAACAIGLAGFSTYSKGLTALRNARLNINALMSTAVTGAFLIGQWPEAAMVMALYAIAELIEAQSVDRARNAIKGLLDLTPQIGDMRVADGNWSNVPVKSVPVGAIVRVKPGERVPLDGVVVAGMSSVNQAPVTGESIPVDKAAGDPVFAATINTTGTLEVRVTSGAGATLLDRIIHTVEQAQGARAPTQQFVDRFAAIYTPTVFVLALTVAFLTPLLMGWPWMQGLYKALVLLVIACPCALVISTPVTVVSALAAGARRGILIKGGVHLENARRVTAVAMDKTGTITQGKPELVAHELLTTTILGEQVLHWAADLAAHSDHPVAQAVAAGLARHACNGDLTGFEALPGRGIRAQAHGVALILGNHRLMEERGLCSPALEARLGLHERQGRTVTLLASDNEVLALFAVADAIKETSREAVAELRALGVRSIMLTGDNEATARSIAAGAGIDDARGNLLPDDKLSAIEAMQRQSNFVAMTGDGINDAPALARADLGFAMGDAGTDIAMEAADVVIMNDDLRRIPETIKLSRRAHAVLWQNIGLALGIKAVFLVLAVAGNASMWMAVFADMGASLLVVFNGLRLLRVRN